MRSRLRTSLRTGLRWGLRLLLLAYFAAGSLILIGRHYLMPEISGQRDWIAARLSEAIGLPVEVAGLTASWPGLHPRLEIDGLRIHDRNGQPALQLARVDAEIGWSTLWNFELRLHRLDIQAPALDLRRDAQGVVWVAGLAVQGEGDGGGSFARWLLDQRRIVVRDARITWHDELRAASPLVLAAVQFELRNFAGHHSFGLRAQPEGDSAELLDVRGNLRGDNLDRLADWQGQLYAELARADIAAWTPWLDLPLEMNRGRGSLRLWFDFDKAQLTALTADLHLNDFDLRLRPDLPRLALARLAGRVTLHRTGKGYSGEIRRLALATHDGIAPPPLSAKLDWVTGGKRAGGELSIDRLDLTLLTGLALHLPLPDALLEQLAVLSPRGQMDELSLRWSGAIEEPSDWSAHGRFAGLALAPHQNLPGFSGISGRFEGSAASGTIHIDSREVQLELPAIFPESTLTLAQLQLEAGWRQREGSTEFQLLRANFHNRDASGEASGSYRYSSTGLGTIDLSARLRQAAGPAVWRYMPLVVNADARHWLQAGIVGGSSDETTLRLKGPLEAFPFADGKQGIFQVKGSIRNGSLHYADGWPPITGIDGDLLFEGVHMRIRGQRAEIMGVALSNVVAEIPHLDAYEEHLTVTGKAQGPTQRFLDFIEASPVGGMIDHFTEPMQAEGKGNLDLRLELPLRKLSNTRVQGKYRFADNRLKVLPALPELSKVEGELGFSESRLEGKALRANLFGGPVNVAVTSAPGGVVKVDAKGSLAAAALRQAYAWPLLDHLSGEAKWTAAIRVKKPGAEVRIESSLEGLSASLPAPFNKSARDALPLLLNAQIDRGRNRDEWSGSLGKLASLRFVMAEKLRGAVGIGQALPASLPPAGFAIGATLPGLDVDAWRRLLLPADNGTSGTTATATATADGVSVTSFDLRSPAVKAWERDFHEVRLSGNETGGRWRLAVDSREALGQLAWEAAGNGKLSGKLARLQIPSATVPAGEATAASAATGTRRPPPDIELQVDDFRYGDMNLGALRVAARRQGEAWQTKLDVRNEAAHLTGEGRWQLDRDQTGLSFKLAIDDAEKLLGRLGLADAVRRGTGQLDGELLWPGTPDDFSLAQLSGKLVADIGKGQFKKLEPGVGRLLGVLSLQSLPRRITLDFRDIFSEGFAFDSIAGKAAIDRGVLRSDELRIRGPAAKILLSGQVSLPDETQTLKVRVQPALGETVAVGAMIANPVVGAVAWLAQKALNDPLDQIFAYEYAVNGSWQEPKVEKISANPGKETTESKEPRENRP